MVVDVLLHRLFLAPPLRRQQGTVAAIRSEMNVTLIYVVTVVLISVCIGIYRVLVRPKSVRTGLALGAFIGLALGVSAGLGTFIHMPIPPAVAMGWFVGGWLKGLVAGAIAGAVIVES
jgi:hypothetical protein